MTHSYVNFSCFVLLSHQKFDGRILFKPAALFDLLSFWIASKQIYKFCYEQIQYNIEFTFREKKNSYSKNPPYLLDDPCACVCVYTHTYKCHSINKKEKLDENYTRMLRAILNKSWRQRLTRHQLYGHLPPIMKTIQVRRTRHVGHCWRSKDELISDVLLWPPHMAKRRRDDQLELTYSSYVKTRDVTWRPAGGDEK